MSVKVWCRAAARCVPATYFQACKWKTHYGPARRPPLCPHPSVRCGSNRQQIGKEDTTWFLSTGKKRVTHDSHFPPRCLFQVLLFRHAKQRGEVTALLSNGPSQPPNPHSTSNRLTFAGSFLIAFHPQYGLICTLSIRRTSALSLAATAAFPLLQATSFHGWMTNSFENWHQLP